MKAVDPSIFPRRRVQLVRQSETAECGLAALAMILNFWGARVDLPALRRRFNLSSRGMGLQDIMQIADELHLAARPVRLDLDDLYTLDVPAILHWDMNHFVVLGQTRRAKAWIADPATNACWHDSASLSRHFTGIALELRPTSEFRVLRDQRAIRLSQLWTNVRGFKRSFVQVAILSLLLQAFTLASPYMLEIAVDRALPALDLDLLTVLGSGYVLFACVFGIAHLLRANVLLATGTAFSFAIASNVGRRLLRLPIGWHQKRSVGDILSRFRSIEPIEKLLTESAAAAVVDGGLALLTFAMMLVYSARLAAISCASLILYALGRLLALRFERSAEAEHIVAQGLEQTVMIESLQGIVSLRLSGEEFLRHATWQNRLSGSLAARYAHDRIRVLHQSFGIWLSAVEQVIVIWIAIHLAIAGGFTVGMILAYLTYQMSFSVSARRMVDEAVGARLLNLHLDRLADIVLEPEDEGFAETSILVAPAKPPGRISLRGIRYAYSDNEPSVLDRLELDIEAGDYLAITGPSGGGKSTLIKILLGLITPDDGDVLIDGEPLSRYGRRRLRAHVGAVLQNDVLFDGDIAQNVAGFDTVDETRLAEVLEAADLTLAVSQMPMRHRTLVGDMTASLSGGQRQRVLLARALYRRPSILVMDEGTAHLDAASEGRVNDAIGAMGITRIIVAHRAETIASASRVVEIVDGRVVRDERRTGAILKSVQTDPACH